MDNNKSQLIDLWRTSFNDSEEFIKLFFDRVYKKENALFIEKNGKIVSALQMLPYVMTYYGKEISVNYIYGACTLPSERGQGLMRQLIQKAFEVMERGLNSHYPGRSMAVRLLPRFRIYGSFRLFRRNVYLPF